MPRVCRDGQRSSGRGVAQAAIEYVIHISVDGVNAGMLQGYIAADPVAFSNYKRFVDEGESTFNARTDYEYTVTQPNHTCMVTGRPVIEAAGQSQDTAHYYTYNNDPNPSWTLHNQHPTPGIYISSVWDVAHDNSVSTSHFASKTKFIIHPQTYEAAGGPDTTLPPDDGTDKIDNFTILVSRHLKTGYGLGNGHDPGPSMQLRRRASHVIFDMDGVLLDTERFYTQSTQQIVGRYGKTFDWFIKSNMVGRPALESARYLVRVLELPMTPEDYLREREALLARLAPESQAMPGARELTALLAQRGVGQSVATSSNRRLYELKTQRHREWFRVFKAVIVGDDPRLRRGKPAPDIFLLAAREVGVDPSECVVIEDSPAGVAAALAADMQVVAVPDPAMERTRFADADLVVGSLTGLRLGDLGLEA